MPNAPYTDPPTSPQVKNEADSIYFGWMGLAQDATFRANMASVLCDGIKCALTDPAVATAWTAIIADAIYDAAVAMEADGLAPSADDFKKAAILIAIGAASVKRSVFVQASDSPSLNQLNADAQEILNVLFP
jgi:hypothetical protein